MPEPLSNDTPAVSPDALKDAILGRGYVPVWTESEPHTLCGYYKFTDEVKALLPPGERLPFRGKIEMWALNMQAPLIDGHHDYSADALVGTIAIKPTATEIKALPRDGSRWETEGHMPEINREKPELMERDAKLNPVYGLARTVIENKDHHDRLFRVEGKIQEVQQELRHQQRTAKFYSEWTSLG
jgi:hypothetical protein